jgi:hypothetical protein
MREQLFSCQSRKENYFFKKIKNNFPPYLLIFSMSLLISFVDGKTMKGITKLAWKLTV